MMIARSVEIVPSLDRCSSAPFLIPISFSLRCSKMAAERTEIVVLLFEDQMHMYYFHVLKSSIYVIFGRFPQIPSALSLPGNGAIRETRRGSCHRCRYWRISCRILSRTALYFPGSGRSPCQRECCAPVARLIASSRFFPLRQVQIMI